MRYFFILMILVISFSVKAQNSGAIKNKITVKEFATLSSDYEQVQKGLKLLESQRLELEKKLKQHDSTFQVLNAKLGQWEQKTDAAIANVAASNSQNQLLNATKQMQETQMSFNLQYLQLQSQMQHENRSYTAISNIMKTKHDTVKNSISNVR
jgi:septal ring factor EnvC (AmiA/AmiB activator)